jgi:hypothetical protein
MQVFSRTLTAVFAETLSLINSLIFQCVVGCMLGFAVTCVVSGSVVAADLRVGTFEVDASPKIGGPLAYDPTKEITSPLSCRGIVLLSDQAPVVLCTVDWLGIANGANEKFRASLAAAVGTTADRVAVHTLHQHDAPRCDLTAAEILFPYGQTAAHFDVPLIEQVIASASSAAAIAAKNARPISEVGVGKAEVKDVASNRRILDADGKVIATRYTACKDPKMRALPTGVVDPMLRLITFYGPSEPIAVLTFYATHPQSYYRTGGANPDFPGMARNARQTETGVFHLHFNGAGGNIGAGKFNDGSTENRQILADKVAAGMRQAFANQQRQQPARLSLDWQSIPVSLPCATHLNSQELEDAVASDATPFALRVHSAEKLAFLRRSEAGVQIPIGRLKIGENQLLFMPGELFVEYQLAAQHMVPDANIFMAAYGEYGTFYIGTRVAYPQGGYETSVGATNVAPESEAVLLDAMRELLGVPESRVLASDFTDRVGSGLEP